MNAVAELATDYADTLRDYIRAGLVLVPIPAGSKAPRGKGWNLRAHCWTNPRQVPDGYSGNVGLAHAYADTCALDIDDATLATSALAAAGIDLGSLLSAPNAVHIHSGRIGRDKLLFRLRDPLASINRSGAEGFELRCASCNGLAVQDVLPPSIHPDTGHPYQWAGDWRALPDIPANLLALWHRLLDTPVTARMATRARCAPERITEGERNTRLLRMTAQLLRRDNDHQAVADTIQKANATQAEVPLDAREVDCIVAQAVQYGSDGWSPYTDRLHDDMARLLPNPSRLIVLTALRRYDGTNARSITLPHDACRDIQGCADEKAFYRYRALAVKHGFLILSRKGYRTRNGAMHTEYEIPDRYLPKGGKSPTLRNRGKSTPLQKALTGVKALAPEVRLKGRRRDRNTSEAQR